MSFSGQKLLENSVVSGGTHFEPINAEAQDNTSTVAEGADTHVLAFYLPQFHPIPENNSAHGDGFTEWTNVIKTKPLFKGHYQPRIPGELSFYDLRSLEVMRQQIDMAISHGLTGFCFYYYYFAGKKLLYKPIQNFIDSGIDFPFCFLWANENWSKRWDGGDNELIIKQVHSREDDEIFIRQLLPVFRDKRYIKIGGKPVVMVYKTHLFEDIKATTETWRVEVEKAGLPGLYLIMVDDWFKHHYHPRELGFDASYEIPSNRTVPEVCVDDLTAYEPGSDFKGRLVDYYKFSNWHSGRPFPEYKRFKTVMAPWDNTPRYGNRAIVHVNTGNDSYRMWVTKAYLDTYKRYPAGERLVFIHSWNEWCEGTYIEPDGRNGRRYLEETREAIADAKGVIKFSEETGMSLEMGSLINRMSRDREAAFYQILKGARIEADMAWHQAAKANDEIRSMLRSRSWRISKPVRIAGMVMRKIKAMAR